MNALLFFAHSSLFIQIPNRSVRQQLTQTDVGCGARACDESAFQFDVKGFTTAVPASPVSDIENPVSHFPALRPEHGDQMRIAMLPCGIANTKLHRSHIIS